MKLKKVLLSGLILSGGLFADGLSDTTALIEQIKTVDRSERFELMNKIKTNISSLNEADKTAAITQMRTARQEAREARFAKRKSTMTPEQVIAFEEKIKAKQEARKNLKEQRAKFRESLTDEQRKQLDSIKKSQRTTRYGKKGQRGGKRINSKVHTTLSAEKLEALKQRKEQRSENRRK